MRKVSIEGAEYVLNFQSPYPFERDRISASVLRGGGGGYSIVFEGREFVTFLNPESILEQLYGPNWRVPIVDEAHVHGKAAWRDGFHG